VVETPQATPADGEVAERVDHVGNELLANTPLGIPEVDFFVVGSKTMELYHQNGRTLYISDALVNHCKTDDELAAVLALEIGQITAEFRRGVRKQAREPMPTVANGPKFDGTTDFDPARDMQLAQLDKARQSPAARQDWPTVDPKEIAAELLKNAGRDPKRLIEVVPLVRDANNGPNAGRLGTAAAAPKWSW
jgi:predicted Zn-dependent protease